MLCPRCGKENPEEQTLCSACGAPLSQAGGWAPAASRTSGLAIASLVVGIVGLLPAVVLGILGPFAMGVSALVALPLGIIALTQINRSQGRLSGKGLAIGGICLGGCSLLLVPLVLAMLFPVFARAREAARKVQCLANVKQLALELQMYQSDWGVLPDAATWCDAVEEYIVNPRVYVCPSAHGVRCGYAYSSALSNLALTTVANRSRRWRSSRATAAGTRPAASRCCAGSRAT